MMNGDISTEDLYADDLTWREQEVLILLSERLTNREIADRLHLVEGTVKDYVGKILSKLYVKNRRQAVERAKALGLLDDDRRTAVSPPIQLPAEPTPFVGRSDDLVEIKRYLGETRLLTLTGPGGMGKTRLALKAAEGVAGEFDDGCFFISLAPLRSADRIVQTIAEGVRFPLATHEDPQHQLIRYLRNKELLLVMDNFEHLLDGVSYVSEILEAAPDVKILATSRERLNLQSEAILIVGGMAHPTQMEADDALQYDAVNLFVQSARKVRPGYNPSHSELKRIVEICHIVGGMPLGIELAAAWLHILNVDEVAEELETGIDILATEVRDGPTRHRSIHAVFDHSWSMLDKAEQEICMWLSVFRGGFTRRAAQQVARASLQQLEGLVSKSFLSHDPDTGRLEFHEMLRQYIQQQLDKAPEASASAQEAHAAYYAAFMGRSWENLKGARQMLAIAEIEADLENVRAAWRFYLEQENAHQMELFVNGFREIHWIRGWNLAGMELFAEAASQLQDKEDDESATLHALVVSSQGYFMSWLGLSDQGYELAKQSAEILEKRNHPEALAFAYESMSMNSYCLNMFMDEITGKNRLLEIATELDDRWLLALALFEKSMVALRNKDYTETERLAQSSLELYEEIGNRIRSILPLLPLGHAASDCGRYEEAREQYLRIVKISQETGFLWGIEKGCKYLGKVALSMDKIPEAETYLRQSMRITNEIGLTRDIPNLLFEFSCLLVAKGNAEKAAELLVLVLKHPASHQLRLGEGRIRDSAKDLLNQIEGMLPLETYLAAMERGQELEVDEVIIGLVGPMKF
jgi:predicted ATPase/DNA-binding CsgD family transcriptional regulator